MIYLLSNTKVKDSNVIELPVIKFNTLKSDLNLSSYDMLIFTSKQAVKSINSLTNEWKNIPSLSIGSATSSIIKMLGGIVEYEETMANAQALSLTILKKYSQKKVLYIRAKEVSLDIKQFLQNEHMYIDERIVYETNCIEYGIECTPKDNSIIIFTSPSTIDCFFKSFNWNNSYKAVSIGKNTNSYLPAHIDSYIANESTVDSCIKKAKDLLLSSNSK